MTNETSSRAPLPSAAEIAKLPADGGPHFNRLIHERSPYLLQHARNPVDWFPWGEEAFAKARKENKPIFLSIGYSSCHWCHVMEHESFEHDDVAKILNTLFVPVKVDREERPDIDDIYMVATQLMTGRGGWPNSVWLMPDGRPWYAGTYFPREDRPGLPGFKTLLNSLAQAWTNRPKDIEEQATQLADAIRQNAASTNRPYDGPLEGLVSNAIDALAANFDARHGGFGDAPKFPPHSSLALLLDAPKSEKTLRLLTVTLDAMHCGGIHDHIGGGFHRYSTDERWFLPHFEKMLYDNAQLASVYARAFALTSNETYRATTRGLCDFILRDMTGPEGAFHSALDADSEGEEGRFYVWTRDEIIKVLGPDDGELFCRTYRIEAGGNYHDEASGVATGRNIPYLAQPATNDVARLAACSEKLRIVRSKRVWPGLDDKVLTAWNGLMIGGLATAGRTCGEPRYVKAAERCASFLLQAMYREGRLLRSYRDGNAAIDGFLDDYAFLADGLLDLAEATGNDDWRKQARLLADDLVAHFYDREAGGFFTTSDRHEKLLLRSKDAFDQAAPSGNAVAIRVLLRLAGDGNEFRALAEKSLRTHAYVMRRAPTGASALLRNLLLLPAPAAAEHETMKAELQLDVATGHVATGRVILTVADGFHVNANPAGENLIPTSLALAKSGSLQLAVDYPRGDDQRTYRGRVTIPFTLRSEEKWPAEPIEFILTAQPCDETSCRAPAKLRLVSP